VSPGADSFNAHLERMNRFQEPEARALIRDLALPKGSLGLDVGCGVGLFARWLAESTAPGGRVVALENNPERLDGARRRLGAANDVELREGDATALAIDDASADWVWCGDVLHHVLDTEAALREFRRVVRPGGLVVIKESQVVPAVFLPGHPELERRIQLAEMERTREEGGGTSFQARRQRTLASCRAAGLTDLTMRTIVIERRAPLAAADRTYIQESVFDRNWGERLREWVSAEDWAARDALCEAASPRNVLRAPEYYCLYPVTVFVARR
jgi:ubiquinone/menaquinone biosynthesis C-methylase UbiE